MKTHTVKAADIATRWYVIDAEGKPMGRVASNVARVLRGKHRPEFSPHLSLGDHVIVVNAEKAHVSGKKMERKLYYRYTGYMGGLRVRTMKETMDRDPTRAMRRAVRGMLPKNRLGSALLKNLRVYKGSEHPHVAQTPDVLPES